jgi:hypothetical protein
MSRIPGLAGRPAFKFGAAAVVQPESAFFAGQRSITVDKPRHRNLSPRDVRPKTVRQLISQHHHRDFRRAVRRAISLELSDGDTIVWNLKQFPCKFCR